MSNNGTAVISIEEYREMVERIVVMERMITENEILLKQLKNELDELERKNEYLETFHECSKKWMDECRGMYGHRFLEWMDENISERTEKLKRAIEESGESEQWQR